MLKSNLIGPRVVWLASSKADPVYASTQPSLPSYSAAGKNHYVGGGVGQGGPGVGTGVQQVYIYIYVCVALGEESVVAKYTKKVYDI